MTQWSNRRPVQRTVAGATLRLGLDVEALRT